MSCRFRRSRLALRPLATGPVPPRGRSLLRCALAAAALAGSGCAALPAADTEPQPPRPPAAAKPASPIATGGSTAPAPAGARTDHGATPARAAPPSSASATTAAAPAGQPRPFADVIKDAKESVGLFRVWQKEDKVWLEIAPEEFDVPFHFLMSHARGVGEQRVYGGMTGPSHIAIWRKVGSNVQLVARNTQFVAKAGAPMSVAVREAFSDSLLAGAALASQPHVERKSVLVELNSVLLTDLPAASYFAYGVHQRGYTFDARNSSLESVHVTADSVSALVQAHYTNPKATLPPAPGGASTPSFPPFDTLPDRRSLFLGVQYSFTRLPEPMRPRLADPRIGHHTDEVWDYTDDQPRTARQHLVQRWRLEKKDPAAALSEPVKPIVYWIDRNVPDKYRAAVRDGILEWNKAFEQIGFKDAIRVEIQPDAADWSTADARHASVRWFAGTDTTFAIGPRTTDPRTGEILDADVAIPESWARGERRLVREDLHAASVWPTVDALWGGTGGAPVCRHASDALAEAQFGLDLLIERGEIAPNSPEAEAFVLTSVKEVVMHEIGHTLGLRHNFRASTAYALEKLSDREFTRSHGLAGSVMDYSPVNLALAGERQGEYHQSTLGPYDYWAIEYAYRPLDPATQAQELARIAAAGAEDPRLAFSSDPEAMAGLDPAASQWDLGDEPLAYLERRLKLSRELWTRLAAKRLEPGQPYDVIRRSFDSGLRQFARATQLVTKYVGGVSYVRDFAGTGRYPLTPVPAAKQRAALKLLAEAVFSADSFRFPPRFLQRMGIDYLEIDGPNVNPDFSLSARVLALHAGALGQLMSDSVAARLLESEGKVNETGRSLRLAELYAALHAAIWSELKVGQEIPLIRRNLQREHANRVALALLRPAATMPADARALARVRAVELRAQLAAALKKPGYGQVEQAHLAQALATIDEALGAPLVRHAG